MAAAARSLRLGICTCSRVARPQNVAPIVTFKRLKSISSIGRRVTKRAEEKRHPWEGFSLERDGVFDQEAADELAGLSEEEIAKRDDIDAAVVDKWIENMKTKSPVFAQLDKEVAPLLKQWERLPPKRIMRDYWNEEEDDPDMITNNVGEDEFDENDITSMAHGKLEEHREMREYARFAIWEMPLLSQFAKAFEPPSQDQVLRFRYTSYMGEFHAAERRVTLEFCPKDLPLSEAEQLKLKKLVGPRYNPEKDLVHMGCEMFDNQAQNKRYLGDLVDKLMTEARDHTDMFEDIPLDTRHHTVKKKLLFPEEWKLTKERRKELDELRSQAQLQDTAKKAEGSLVDGLVSIQLALDSPQAAMAERVAELVSASPRRRSQTQKQMRIR